MPDPRPAAVDYDKLSEYLKALANPVRLQILESLRLPKAAGELRLAPRRGAPQVERERAMARQSVKGHIEVLEAVGLLERLEARKGQRVVEEYVLDHTRLFAVIEELRRLSTLRAAGVRDPHATLGAEQAAAEGWLPGPKLVLVGGPLEGKAFLLPEGAGPWVIGRKKDADIRLDYDPFVSQQNAEVARDGEGWSVRDLPASKNGTLLNFIGLPKDEPRPLDPGDIIGVGRSTLVFRER